MTAAQWGTGLLTGVGFIAVVFIATSWWLTVDSIVASLLRRRRHQRRQLIARADRQHTWVLEGDPRGTYGEYHEPFDHQVWKVGFRG